MVSGTMWFNGVLACPKCGIVQLKSSYFPNSITQNQLEAKFLERGGRVHYPSNE